MVEIREYIEADWENVCRVHDAARPDELNGSCDPRAFVPLKDDPEADELRDSSIVIAKKQGEVVGFAAVKDSYLSFLYVDPAHYQEGIGRRLLKASLELATEEPWTIVLAGNEPAISLYRSEGFVEVARFNSDNEGYPVTCIRMAKVSA